jgi:DNA-binding GntR family transcriptional regulator
MPQTYRNTDRKFFTTSDQAKVQDLVSQITARRARFNLDPSILELDGRYISTLYEATKSKILSLSEEQLKMVTRNFFDLSPTKVKSVDPRFNELSEEITQEFAYFRTQSSQAMTRMEFKLQQRLIERSQVKQEFKKIGR